MGLIIPNSFANKTSAQLSDLDENFTYLQTELDPYINNILVDESGQVTIGGGVVANVTGNVIGNVTGDVTGNVSGNSGTVTNGVYTTGDQTIGGTKTFSNTISGSIDGNAATATKFTTTSGSQPVYAFRAWAVVKNTGSAFSILAGNGITSVTYSNSGQTATVNITSGNQPTSADYGILVTCASPAGAQGQRYGSVTSRTTSAFSINFSDDSSLNPVDEFTVMVIY
jgi:hypothetical protein